MFSWRLKGGKTGWDISEGLDESILTEQFICEKIITHLFIVLGIRIINYMQGIHNLGGPTQIKNSL